MALGTLMNFLLPRALAQQPPPATGGTGHLSMKLRDVRWEKLEPGWGADSPEVAFLRIDPTTRATHLLVRHPRAMHIPRHWHSANETHTVIAGTYIFECDGKRDELGPGSFNYFPKKMIHQVWAPDNGIFFITVDAAWDVNWVDGPPKRPR